MKTTTAKKIETTVRCKAFSGQGVREHRIQIDGDTVRVWDDVAGHYTTCHTLSPATQRRIIRAARLVAK